MAARAGLAAVVSVFAALWLAVGGEGRGEEAPECRLIRLAGSSVLQQCGGELYSLTLRLWDVRRPIEAVGFAPFEFACTIEPMCLNEPKIFGWYVDPAAWRRSGRDGGALLDLVRQTSPFEKQLPEPPTTETTCESFDVTVGDIPGRAACYHIADTPLNFLAVVAGDGRAAFVLMFADEKLDETGLRENALRKLPKFAAVRAVGESPLLRWFR